MHYYIKLIFIRPFIFAVIFIVSAPVAFAGLGDPAESVHLDKKNLSSKLVNSDIYPAYSTQNLESDSSTIKEYINKDGIIFAITWQGLDHPDLSVLLGSHYENYKTLVKLEPPQAGRRHHSVKRENLVVQKWGNMRNLRGRAYDPLLLPPGVALDEIK